MPKIAKELTAIAVAKLKAPGRYAVGGAKGLHLRITPAGARLWVCRLLTPDGRRQDIGLGSPPDVSLSDARDKARDAYRAVQAGAAPAPRSKAAKPQPPTPAHTFRAAALELVAAKGAAWSNAKHLAQWTRSLEAHAFPTIGQMDVADIGLDHVLQVLRPIWTTKTETATRIRGRIEATLDYAAVHGWRAGDNPARWKGLLDKVLPSPLKISTPEHHKAMPAEAVPSLMASLCAANTLAALALRLLILTAARSGEVRGAVWAEFDVVAGVWIIPAARMKAKTEHRIPLSTQALALLKAIPRIEDCPLLFPSATSLGRPISDPVRGEPRGLARGSERQRRRRSQC